MYYNFDSWSNSKRDAKALASDWKAVGDDIRTVLFGSPFEEDAPSKRTDRMKCIYCESELEADFVDIGVGSQQVSDWQCPNDQCPEYLDWLKKHHDKAEGQA